MTAGRLGAAAVAIAVSVLVLACVLILIPDDSISQQATLSIDGPLSPYLAFISPQTDTGIIDVTGDKNASMALGCNDSVGMNVSMTTTVHQAFGIINNGYDDVSISLIKEGDMVSAVRFSPLEGGIVLGPGESAMIDIDIDTSGGTCGSEVLKKAIVWATGT